jgi:hypothetical protein
MRYPLDLAADRLAADRLAAVGQYYSVGLPRYR